MSEEGQEEADEKEGAHNIHDEDKETDDDN